MEGGGGKALPVDIGKVAHHAAVTSTEQVKIVRMFAVFSEHGNGIDARPIMMKLAFDAAVLSSVQEIPVTTRAAVVSPMRDGWHVSDNRIDCNFCLVVVSEVFAPRIDLFLSGGIPGHLAAERI